VSSICHKDVRGLDVAMNDSCGMRGMKCISIRFPGEISSAAGRAVGRGVFVQPRPRAIIPPSLRSCFAEPTGKRESGNGVYLTLANRTNGWDGSGSNSAGNAYRMRRQAFQNAASSTTKANRSIVAPCGELQL
jgi:hypothetical protein